MVLGFGPVAASAIASVKTSSVVVNTTQDDQTLVATGELPITGLVNTTQDDQTLVATGEEPTLSICKLSAVATAHGVAATASTASITYDNVLVGYDSSSVTQQSVIAAAVVNNIIAEIHCG